MSGGTGIVRAKTAGLADGMRFRLPLTQAELGDALGLSIVHTNRTLQRIRRSGVFEWQDRHAVVKDWQALSEMGQFDQTYLHLEKVRR